MSEGTFYDVGDAERSAAAVAEAQRVLNEDRQRRAGEATARIQAALEEWRCELRAFVVVGGQAVAVPVQVVAV